MRGPTCGNRQFDLLTETVRNRKQIPSFQRRKFSRARFTMSVQDATPDLVKLEAQLDNLEACLEPLLENLSGHASQLPLVDRAKLYTLTNYALESLLFCELAFMMMLS